MYQLPLLTPQSGWKAPTELPDLRGRPEVGIDTETKDDSLSAGRGPGWAYGRAGGYVCGVSYSTDGVQGYVPIAHPDTECFDKDKVSEWLRDLVRSRTPLVFQNGPYDLGWLLADLGVDVPPEYPIDDMLCADFMCDENQYEYNMDAICARRGVLGKNESLLWEAGSAYLRPANAPRSWKLTPKILKTNMWRLPARYVGEYAEIDALRPRQVMQKLRPVMEDEGTTAAYRLEMDLVPTIRDMRARGILIDTDRAEQAREHYRGKRDAIVAECARRLPGRGLSSIDQFRTAKWLDPVFGDERIQVPLTKKTEKNSYKSEWMDKSDHWLPKLISQALDYDAFAEKFVDNYVLGFTHRGRIHAEVHQYKSDDGGAVSYRFAYSSPPLQQAVSPDTGKPRSQELGPVFRSLFLADGTWEANDYSQQEYRLTAHFAAVTKVRGGADACQQFIDNPELDFHQMVAELTGLPRGLAKIQNFAILYGQGLKATAQKLGITEEEAKDLRDKVAREAPFGPALDDELKRRASSRGFLRLIDGARVRFSEWEAGWIAPEEFKRGMAEHKKMTPCSLAEAHERRADPTHPWHGASIRRADTRVALNRQIQGSAARQTKLAMREGRRAGLTFLMQMHDELDVDILAPEQRGVMAEIMRTVVPLRLPMKVDVGWGDSWAAAKSKDAAEPKKIVDIGEKSADPTHRDAAHRAGSLETLINSRR